MNKKIYLKSNIKKILYDKKKRGLKISMCHGCFDLLHLGHIDHLIESKNLSDILVVSVTSDKYVNKGLNRPFFKLAERMESLAALSCVDYIIPSNSESAIESLKTVKPNFYCKGPDYKLIKNDTTKKIKKEISELKKFKGKFYITKSKQFSSSKLVNNSYLYNSEQLNFLKKIKKKKSFAEISKIVQQFKKIDITIIGESIIDVYQKCNPVGKSGKEPTLIFSNEKNFTFLGGALAISKNISEFVNKVNLISYLGSTKKYLKFIKKKLNSNINYKYILKKKSPTIEKKRLIETYSNKKIICIYDFNDTYLDKSAEKKIIDLIDKSLKKNTILLIADYGHGLITKNIIKKINTSKNFKLLNCQLNASNTGLNLINNYNKPDILIMNEAEIRYEMKNRQNSLEILMKEIVQKIKTNYVFVTRGSKGSICYNKIKNKFYYCPGFANNVVDKVGAGDSMLAIIALTLFLTKDEELALFLSSIAASEIVAFLGNEKNIKRLNYLRNLEILLKV